ncbi:hypothetical protein [Methylorubrum aminovorans]
MARDPYIVRPETLPSAFPPGHEPPRLLLDFADWLEGRPWGSLGCFRLQGTLSDEAPIVDGSALRREFSLFLYLPDGSLVGFWHPDGVPTPSSPVVGLGSEGDAAVLAGSLEGFLAKLARDAFSDSAWSDLAAVEEDEEDDEEEDEGNPTRAADDNARDALADWLAGRVGPKRLDALAGEVCDSTAFAARMDAWMHERETYWAEHLILTEIGRALSANRPPGTTPWDRTQLRAAIVGTLCEVQVYRAGPQPVPEIAQVEPLLRALRDEQHRTDPDLGLWFEAHLTLDANGCILPRFDYQTRPILGGAPAPVEQARSDLSRAPRSARWVPDWLADSRA